MTIRNAIYSRLNGYAGLTSLVASRVYSKAVSQESTRPLVFFEITGTERMSAMSADTNKVDRRFRVISEAETLSDAVDVAEQVRLALQRWSGTEDSIVIIDTLIDEEVDYYNDDLNISYIEQFFTITHEE